MKFSKTKKQNENEIAVTFSEEQLNILKKRILKEEEGKAIYHNAREVVREIKRNLKNVKPVK